jgi:hypothetical protein
VLRNPLKRPKSHFSDPQFHNNIRKTESFTNRLLYQLSYVGFVQCLYGYLRFSEARRARTWPLILSALFQLPHGCPALLFGF